MNIHRPNRQLGFQTRAIHEGYDPLLERGAVSPPIYMTSTFAFANVADADAVVAGESDGFLYGREHNPTQALLEQRVASLEGAEAGVAAASGMAAISSLFLSLLSPGDEVIVHETLYSNTTALTGEGLPRFGIKVVKVDLSEPANLTAAITGNSRLVYFETPINPTGEVLDIAAISALAHQAGLRVVVDSTFASPAVQRPLEHGADIVVHSLTKYINGHGDLLGGIVLGDAETMHKVRGLGLRYLTGATLSPMACFLVLRGLKTLKVRMRQHGENGLAVAQMLAAHPAVRVVRYPFLESYPRHAIARKQMVNGSGMMSFELHDGYDGAVRMMDRLKLIARAVSLGDVESLIMHPGSLLQARRKVFPEAKLGTGVTMDLMRLSVGLEDAEDLIDDLKQALGGD
ncbi:trans-sulfuration enzyme family protein [Bosea sp. (in: a-proteobacteria)]|uniref:trans-sulfuration enzyme family protein n=1 Tax=Bosea sp. (in: a-proteobacteria) TaxID=1871050 RepID=UPI002FC7E755